MWHLCTEMSKEDYLIITKNNRMYALRTFCYHEQKKRLHVEGITSMCSLFFSFGIACFKGIHHAYSFLRSVYGTLLPIPEDT